MSVSAGLVGCKEAATSVYPGIPGHTCRSALSEVSGHFVPRKPISVFRGTSPKASDVKLM